MRLSPWKEISATGTDRQVSPANQRFICTRHTLIGPFQGQKRSPGRTKKTENLSPPGALVVVVFPLLLTLFPSANAALSAHPHSLSNRHRRRRRRWSLFARLALFSSAYPPPALFLPHIGSTLVTRTMRIRKASSVLLPLYPPDGHMWDVTKIPVPVGSSKLVSIPAAQTPKSHALPCVARMDTTTLVSSTVKNVSHELHPNLVNV